MYVFIENDTLYTQPQDSDYNLFTTSSRSKYSSDIPWQLIQLKICNIYIECSVS